MSSSSSPQQKPESQQQSSPSFYCLSCRAKSRVDESQPIEEIVSKNGRAMLRAVCSACGRKVLSFKALKKDAASEKNAKNAECDEK